MRLPSAWPFSLPTLTAPRHHRLFLWTRSRATQDIKTANIRSEHSSMITSIAPIVHQDWVVSGGKDKRVRLPPSFLWALALRELSTDSSTPCRSSPMTSTAWHRRGKPCCTARS